MLRFCTAVPSGSVALVVDTTLMSASFLTTVSPRRRRSAAVEVVAWSSPSGSAKWVWCMPERAARALRRWTKAATLPSIQRAAVSAKLLADGQHQADQQVALGEALAEGHRRETTRRSPRCAW